MAKQLLVEGATGAFPFIVDRSKPFVTESVAGGTGTITRIPGRLSVCDCVNGNGRRYRRVIWEKNLTPGSILMDSIKRNSAFGLLEHPKDGVVTLESPISHQVTAATLKEAQGPDGKVIHEVHGEISLYDFGGDMYIPEARKLRVLIEGGYNPLVSSRGYGSLVKDSQGIDDVQEDYVCESFDVVIKPSFEQAELKPNRSSKTTESTPSTDHKTVVESVTPPAAPVATPPVSEAAKSTITEQKVMPIDIKDIRNRIAALRGLNHTKLDTTRFAEGMGLMESIHQDIAVYISEDAKRSWEGTKLHSEVESIAKQWNESVTAPAKRAVKLSEDNVKLMKVIAAVGKTGVAYKAKLGEALKAGAEKGKLVEELTKRGKGWKHLAESRGAKAEKLDKHFDTACEALDIMAERYHADVTEMGRRIIVLEFAEKAQTPEIAKLLKEATRLRHIVSIREKLEGKKEAPKTEAKVEEGKSKEAPVKAVTEAKKDAAKPEDKKVDEGKKADDKKPGTIIESTRFTGASNVNESISMVRRWSTPATK